MGREGGSKGWCTGHQQGDSSGGSGGSGLQGCREVAWFTSYSRPTCSTELRYFPICPVAAEGYSRGHWSLALLACPHTGVWRVAVVGQLQELTAISM